MKHLEYIAMGLLIMALSAAIVALFVGVGYIITQLLTHIPFHLLGFLFIIGGAWLLGMIVAENA